MDKNMELSEEMMDEVTGGMVPRIIVRNDGNEKNDTHKVIPVIIPPIMTKTEPIDIGKPTI